MMNLPSPEMLSNLARQELSCGRVAEAQEKCLQILGEHHHHPAALEVLGEVLFAQRRHEDAVRVFNSLTLMQPAVAVHWQNLGIALRPTGRHAQSLAAFERALQLAPPNAGLLYNLGALQLDRLDYTAAYLALRDAAMLAPREARIRWTYAQCCYDVGRGQEAVAAVEDWETFDGLNTELTVSIALLLTTLGCSHLAQPAVDRLLQDPPQAGRPAIGFAFLLERLHRLEEARAVMERLGPSDAGASSDPQMLLLAATLANRSGQHGEAYRLLSTALSGPDCVHRHDLLYPLAKVCDALGRYEEAYAAAVEAHCSQLAFLEQATAKSSEEQSQLWALTATACDPSDVAAWERAGPSSEAPIFIVGFPRSGTTLLEQVLDAHPCLHSMDEQPFLLRSVARVLERGVRYPAGLARLSGADLDELCALYWAGVRKRSPPLPGQRLVDKNPMNMILLPVIRRLFPDARIIVAVRHPCDTVLSFFFQHFRSDLALLSRDLAALARSYSRAFHYWYSQRELLQPRAYELRYERLSADLPAEVEALCAFLELPLHEAMLAPGKHARAKGFISTPSYAQVIEPVTTRSVGRWRHYASHFANALPILAPWIERWGYSVE